MRCGCQTTLSFGQGGVIELPEQVIGRASTASGIKPTGSCPAVSRSSDRMRRTACGCDCPNVSRLPVWAAQ